jgi:hypothetical protein
MFCSIFQIILTVKYNPLSCVWEFGGEGFQDKWRKWKGE